MGLFARARSLSHPGPKPGSGAGLLRRSQILLERPSPTPETETPPPPRSADELLFRISQIPEGIAAPALLFSLLKEHLGLQAAALLLHDSARQLFVPWCSTGLDTTTRHRLSLPPGLNEPFNRAASGEVTLVEGEELQGFRNHFSSREFALIRQLILVPFVHGQRLLGLLLIARMPSELAGEMPDLLRQAALQAAPLLLRIAGRLADDGLRDTGQPLPELVTGMLESAKQHAHPLLLMRLKLGALLSQAETRFRELEPFRLQEELLLLCRDLFRVIGRVRSLKSNELLILINGMKDADPELLLRELEAVMQASLRELIAEDTVKLAAAYRVVTEDPEAALDFLGDAG
jgi:hypothetical protein